MTEIEKIKYAKSFLDMLAEGYDPTSGQPVPGGDTIRNVRVSRCFAYVSGILAEVIDAGGVPKPRIPRKKFEIAPQKLAEFQCSDEPITVSEFSRRLTAASGEGHMRNLPSRKISAWLIHVGALTEYEDPDGHKHKFPTPDGVRLGILTERRVGKKGDYTVILYNRYAQQFLADNLDAILAYDGKDTEKSAE